MIIVIVLLIIIMMIMIIIIIIIYNMSQKINLAKRRPNGRAEENKKEDKEEKGAIDWIERVALSFALSIAIVPLAVFYLNLIGLKINLLNSFLTILGIIVISGLILFYKNRKL